MSRWRSRAEGDHLGADGRERVLRTQCPFLCGLRGGCGRIRTRGPGVAAAWSCRCWRMAAGRRTAAAPAGMAALVTPDTGLVPGTWAAPGRGQYCGFGVNEGWRGCCHKAAAADAGAEVPAFRAGVASAGPSVRRTNSSGLARAGPGNRPEAVLQRYRLRGLVAADGSRLPPLRGYARCRALPLKGRTEGNRSAQLV